MAKKLTGLFVAFLLLLSGSGFALTIHFCQGEIASARWGGMSADPEDSCCGSDAEKMNDCCADKIVKAEKQSESVLKYFSLDFPVAILSDEPEVLLAYFSVQSWFAQPFASDICANAPPLYLLHHQWVLYA